MLLTSTEIDEFFEECSPDDRGFVHHRTLEEKFSGFILAYEFSSSTIESKEEKTPMSVATTQVMYDKAQFTVLVNSWNVPSRDRKTPALDKDSRIYEAALPIGRRLKAHWATEGYQSTFVTLVICLQTGLAVWLLVKNLEDKTQLNLLGWGLIVAKTSAGVLYPTLTLLILSSSRTLGTWLRRWQMCSRFINWDLSQAFHIQMAIVAVVFATLHVVGHLGGTFVTIRRSMPGEAKRVLHNFPMSQPTYADLITSLPGMTGILSVSIIVFIVICSIPAVRKRNFELFQAAHLLVYPFIGLLMAHGTRGWLQRPMLGYWLAGPTLLLLGERIMRFYRYSIGLKVEVVPQLSDVVLLVVHARKRWNMHPGQYVLICIPAISWFQWHPFTVSSFSDTEFRLHIRTTSGSWTRALAQTKFDKIFVDGPFGAPAERFLDFDRTIVIGTGIGITPYIGALSNKLTERERSKTRLSTADQAIDFHWIARDAKVFSWFAGLLNQVAAGPSSVHISTYLTAREKHVTDYIFSFLLDRGVAHMHSTGSVIGCTRLSQLTGLTNLTSFGRPDFAAILQKNLEDLPASFAGSVGVFFCGPKYVGMEISDRCLSMTQLKNSKVNWVFIGEVF